MGPGLMLVSTDVCVYKKRKRNLVNSRSYLDSLVIIVIYIYAQTKKTVSINNSRRITPVSEYIIHVPSTLQAVTYIK